MECNVLRKMFSRVSPEKLIRFFGKRTSGLDSVMVQRLKPGARKKSLDGPLNSIG